MRWERINAECRVGALKTEWTKPVGLAGQLLYGYRIERSVFVLNRLENVTFERSAVGQIAHTLHVIAANAAPAMVLTNRRR